MGMLRDGFNNWFSGGLYNNEGDYDDEEEGLSSEFGDDDEDDDDEEEDEDEEQDDNEDPYGEDQDPNQEEEAQVEQDKDKESDDDKDKKDKEGNDEKAEAKGKVEGNSKKLSQLKLKKEMQKRARALGFFPIPKKNLCPCCHKKSIYQEKWSATLIRKTGAVIAGALGAYPTNKINMLTLYYCLNPQCIYSYDRKRGVFIIDNGKIFKLGGM